MTRLTINELEYTPEEKEVIHMIAFEYSVDEMKIESGLDHTRLTEIIQSLYRKMEVETHQGLVRVAFEKGVLKVIQT